jgi:cytoskeletal protein RodZ
VSRWLSPQKVARLAEQDRQRRMEKRKTTLTVIGLAVLVLATFAAWVFVQARLRHLRHHNHDKKPSSQSGTNRVGATVPDRARTFAKVEFESHAPRR